MADGLPFTLDQLLIVQAIAQEGSFRRAADSLFISQPAVSLQVQNLERQLGVVLFDRSGRKVELTDAGQVLLQYSERILKLCREAVQALAEVQGMGRGQLVLGASQTVGTYVMPFLIAQYHRYYPGIAVQLLVQSTRRIAQKLVDGRLDLAVVGGEIPFELQRHLKVIAVAEDEYVLVGAPGCTPAAPALGDLVTLPFITLDPQSSTRQTIDRALSRHGINPAQLQVRLELSSIEAIKNAIQAGLGVAFLSMAAVGSDLEQGRLQKLEVEGLQIRRTLWLAYNPERYQSQAATRFREGLLGYQDWLKTPPRHLQLLA
ncbi:LysR substrate-binding domain-containing protein [Synechococcus sp. W65.1]|jgi:DNA-binding transcriptional LysR family regulator|uniref:LysR substrate-binding domain-containing protein n=1 Tax=Synechococcus sp. W65.1 TaxID=2964526 RepID=UPI0039C35592